MKHSRYTLVSESKQQTAGPVQVNEANEANEARRVQEILWRMGWRHFTSKDSIACTAGTKITTPTTRAPAYGGVALL